MRQFGSNKIMNGIDSKEQLYTAFKTIPLSSSEISLLLVSNSSFISGSSCMSGRPSPLRAQGASLNFILIDSASGPQSRSPGKIGAEQLGHL